MTLISIPAPTRTSRRFPLAASVALFVLALLGWTIPSARAQDTLAAQTQPPSAPAQQSPDQTDSGGPSVDNGPIITPKKKESDEPPPPPAPEEPKVKNPNGQTYSLTVNVPEVHLDVSVILDKNHQFVPGLKPPNFLVLEDGVEQRVDTARIVQTPITAVKL